MSCNKNITDNQNPTQSLNQQNILTHHWNVFTDVNIELLENTLPPEILPFNEQLTKNQMEWSDDARYPPLANTALINPESTQHTSNLVDSPQQTINAENLEETTFNATFHDQIKRPLSETKSQQSNSSTKLDDKNSDSILQSTEPFFSSTDNNSAITYLQFKYTIQKFLGVCNWYSQFVDNYADTIAPLTNRLKQGTKWSWTETEQAVFIKTKHALYDSPKRSTPD